MIEVAIIYSLTENSKINEKKYEYKNNSIRRNEKHASHEKPVSNELEKSLVLRNEKPVSNELEKSLVVRNEKLLVYESEKNGTGRKRKLNEIENDNSDIHESEVKKNRREYDTNTNPKQNIKVDEVNALEMKEVKSNEITMKYSTLEKEEIKSNELIKEEVITSEIAMKLNDLEKEPVFKPSYSYKERNFKEIEKNPEIRSAEFYEKKLEKKNGIFSSPCNFKNNYRETDDDIASLLSDSIESESIVSDCSINSSKLFNCNEDSFYNYNKDVVMNGISEEYKDLVDNYSSDASTEIFSDYEDYINDNDTKIELMNNNNNNNNSNSINNNNNINNKDYIDDDDTKIEIMNNNNNNNNSINNKDYIDDDTKIEIMNNNNIDNINNNSNNNRINNNNNIYDNSIKNNNSKNNNNNSNDNNYNNNININDNNSINVNKYISNRNLDYIINIDIKNKKN